MISLRPSKKDELIIFVDLETQTHANRFVNSSDLETHQRNFNNPNVIYLSIENSKGELSGYFILLYEPDEESVEFHRILIDESKRGIGQNAIIEMENYCRSELNVERIWLDVYEDNEIGKHIYEKMGYKQFKEEINDGRKLLFFQKAL